MMLLAPCWLTRLTENVTLKFEEDTKNAYPYLRYCLHTDHTTLGIINVTIQHISISAIFWQS
jgi:hypothetical protein